MKIGSLKTKVIGPMLLLLPMTCMSLGDGHHDGGHHSSINHPSVLSVGHDYQSSGSIIRQDSGGEKSPDTAKALWRPYRLFHDPFASEVAKNTIFRNGLAPKSVLKMIVV